MSQHPPLSPAERAQREKAIQAAMANARLAGQEFPDEEVRIFQRYVDGEWSWEEVSQAMAELDERDFSKP